jgi:hypothetical protein
VYQQQGAQGQQGGGSLNIIPTTDEKKDDNEVTLIMK